MTKENQTGVENKHFKKEQSVPSAFVLNCCCEFMNRMVEALTDPKTWLFTLFAAIINVPASSSNQFQLIVLSFGFNVLQTTLLSCVIGVIIIVSIFSGATIASRVPNSIAWVGVIFFIPGLLGLLLVNLLPWHDKLGLLFSLWISSTHDDL